MLDNRTHQRLIIGIGSYKSNGFGNAAQVLVADEPMMSLYRGDRVRPDADNVVSLR